MLSKKADSNFILSKLPYVVFVLVIAVVVIYLILSIQKGGIDIVANPPVKRLPT